MPELLGIYDGGMMTDKNGHKVGIVIFRISVNEGAPEDIIAHCLPKLPGIDNQKPHTPGISEAGNEDGIRKLTIKIK